MRSMSNKYQLELHTDQKRYHAHGRLFRKRRFASMSLFTTILKRTEIWMKSTEYYYGLFKIITSEFALKAVVGVKIQDATI